MEKKYGFDEVFIIPSKTDVNSRSNVNLNISYTTKISNQTIQGCPVIVANLDTTGSIQMAKQLYKHKMFVGLNKYLEFNKVKDFFKTNESEFSFYTIGLNGDLDKVKELHETSFKYLMIDIANGYISDFLKFVEKTRKIFPKLIIIAGNVCTPEGVKYLVEAGADIVKCGIGQGGLCETSAKAGIGYPQFSVAQECGNYARKIGALAISDGGTKTPADICKSLAAGSHFVMCGSIFLGYDECDGEWTNDKFLKAYGMSSKTANDKYNNGLKEYRTSEGVNEKLISHKGKVENLVLDIKGSLASCCSYTNSFNLQDLPYNSKFICK